MKKTKVKRINSHIPYKECKECHKPIRYYNTSGFCSNCQNKLNTRKKWKELKEQNDLIRQFKEGLKDLKKGKVTKVKGGKKKNGNNKNRAT